MVVTGLVYELLEFKWEIKDVFNRQTVAIVTSDVMEMTTTCSAMIEHLVNIIIVAAIDKYL